MKQPFQCNLQSEIQEPHGTTHTGTTTGCKTHRRNNSRTKRPQPQPPHRRGTFHRRLQPLYTEKYKVSCSGFLPKTTPMQHSCSHSNAICNQRFKNRMELRTHEQALVAKHIGGTIRAQNDRSRNRRTDEVPFIADCNHFTRKNTRFRAPASSPKQRPCNIHAAMTMRFAASRSKPAPIYARGNIKGRQWSSHSNAICNQRFKNRMELRTHEQALVAKHIGGTIRAQNVAAATAAQTRYLSSPAATTLHGKTQGFVLRLPPQNNAHATFMQPFQCNLQPEIQETHGTTHTWTSTGCKTHRRNNSRTKRPQPQPPHRRGTFHRRLQPLYTEKHKVSCSGFLPKTTPMQHSCSHDNAFRSIP